MIIIDTLTYVLFAYAMVTIIFVINLTYKWLNDGLYTSH
jgi:hypothetical protein